MKYLEIILAIAVLIGVIMRWFSFPRGPLISILSFFLLSGIYMCFSFALLNGVRLRDLFKSGSPFKEISQARIGGTVLVGLTLAILVIGILFKMLFWEGADAILQVGLVGSFIAVAVGMSRYLKTKSPFYIGLFKRIIIYGGLGLVLFLIPEMTLVEMKHKDHPAYLEALRKAKENPDNEELWKQVQKEEDKIHDTKTREE